jgi:transcriptional regulator GlxA family with amidase domain
MEENALEPLDLQAIANHASVSIRTLNRQFRDHFGTTPLGLLVRMRIDRARRLLESTELPIDRVAEQSGFGSYASLRYHFPRTVGWPGHNGDDPPRNVCLLQQLVIADLLLGHQAGSMDSRPTHLVVITAFAGIDTIDVAGPAEVFAMANMRLPRSAARYEVRVVAAHRGALPTSSGLCIQVDQAFAELRERPDTIVVTGRVDVGEDHSPTAVVDHDVCDWLAEQGPEAGRVVAVCAGGHIAAAAGLLDGHRATTHWGTAEQLAAENPLVEVDPDPIFVRSGKVWTSAGITASMDLALALVADDHGEEVALRVAQLMVMYVQRPGGQSQFSAALSVPPSTRSGIAELLRWISANLTEDLSVGALARRMGVTPRHLARVFHADVGITPGEFVERVRTEHARRLLERTDLTSDRVAAESGFGSVETLHRVFRTRLGATPREYRQRFAPSPR